MKKNLIFKILWYFFYQEVYRVFIIFIELFSLEFCLWKHYILWTWRLKIKKLHVKLWNEYITKQKSIFFSFGQTSQLNGLDLVHDTATINQSYCLPLTHSGQCAYKRHHMPYSNHCHGKRNKDKCSLRLTVDLPL